MPRRLSRASVVRVFRPRSSVSSTGQSSHILIRCSTRRSTIRRRTLGVNHLPTNQGVFVGSYAAVAQMLDAMATVPGVRGVMLTFDDFIIGMEQFGTRILPLMRCRSDTRRAA